MSWPWGSYLGEEGLRNGIRAKISSWQRIGPNVIPHVAKATGVYLNSMLAVAEANRAGYEEAILLTQDGYIADGSGENIFVVKDGVIYTPDLSASILPGITRDSIIQIAQDLGHRVVEKHAHPHRPLPRRRGLHVRHGRRGDADPRGRRPRGRPARAGDARDPGGVPRHRARPRRAVGAVARVRARGEDDEGVKQEVRAVPLSGPYLDEREEELVLEVLRSGRLSLGPTIDRFEELLRREGRRAVRGGGVVGNRGSASAVRLGGRRRRATR